MWSLGSCVSGVGWIKSRAGKAGGIGGIERSISAAQKREKAGEKTSQKRLRACIHSRVGRRVAVELGACVYGVDWISRIVRERQGVSVASSEASVPRKTRKSGRENGPETVEGMHPQ